MTGWIAEAWPSPRARITGVVYLLYFLTAVFAEVFVGRSRLVVYDAVNLIAYAFYIAVTQLFYYMFKPVSRSLSLLAVSLSLVGCANEVLSLFKLAPYRINSLVFFGPYCLLIGYLIFRSTFLPRILGVLMALAGLGWIHSPIFVLEWCNNGCRQRLSCAGLGCFGLLLPSLSVVAFDPAI